LLAQLPIQLIGLLLPLLYYAVPEAYWGCSLGKRWLGLRVVRSVGVDSPGLWRSLLRTSVFLGLMSLRTLPGLVLLFLGKLNPEDQRLETQFWLRVLLAGLTSYVLMALGIGLVVCTMRARNGYRGLHEWVSGTRVIRLPGARARRQLGSRCLDLTVSPRGDRPERLGVFDVTGVIRVSNREALLLGEDRTLGRKVFLWLRPEGIGKSLRPQRREVSRSTRPRWLAGGRRSEQLWDAFLVPPGHPLPDVVAADGRLYWADTRYLLTQLAEELVASTADQTLPSVLTLDQVWVQADGRLQLLDVPLAQEVPGDGLDLLGDVAALALEGRPRPLDAAPAAIRAPLPQHAARMLDRLMGLHKPYRDVQQFLRDLEATADRPTAVTRSLRFAHLAVQAVLLYLGLAASLLAILPFYLNDREMDIWKYPIVCPAVWIVWAFLWRGGLSLPLFGLSLVRADGQPARRLQCAWRAVVVWAPVTALLACWLWLGWISSGWDALVLLLLYVVLALWSPERALHDRLAGTYLVPR
jgi:uncharacterized RDD family membrane protein YckC